MHSNLRESYFQVLERGPQRWAIVRAQTEMDIRSIEEVIDLQQAAKVREVLGEPWQSDNLVSDLIDHFNVTSQAIAKALTRESVIARRHDLEKAHVYLQEIRLGAESLVDGLYARLLNAANKWLILINSDLEQHPSLTSNYSTKALEMESSLFVGRETIAQDIEDLLRTKKSQAILLLGIRRIGKTSLLLNLSRLINTSVVTVFLSGNDVPSSVSLKDFLLMIAKLLKTAAHTRGIQLPSYEFLQTSDETLFPFNVWMEQVESQLLDNGVQKVLITIDEFEELRIKGEVINSGIREILRLLRYWIENRPFFYVILASAHTIEELGSWAQEIVNYCPIRLSYLKRSETMELIEQPIWHLPIRYESTARERIWELTSGYPLLIHMLCGAVLQLKNVQARPEQERVSRSEVEEAARSILTDMNMPMSAMDQQYLPDQQTLLRQLSSFPESAWVLRSNIDSMLHPALGVLLERELVMENAGNYRIRVELVRRWYAKEASPITEM